MDIKFWFSLQAPAGTPPEVVARLRDAIARAVSSDGFRAAMRERGAEALPVSPAELDGFMQRETAAWVNAARTIGLQPEQ